MIFGMDLSGGQPVTEPLVCRVEELKFSIARILAPDFGRRKDCKRGTEENVYFGGSFADGKPSQCSLLSTLDDPTGIRGLRRSDSSWKQFEQDRFRSHDKHLFLHDLCDQLSPEMSPYARYDQFFNNALKSPDDSVGEQRSFVSNDASSDSKEMKSKRCLLYYSPLDQPSSDDVKPFFSPGLEPGPAGRGSSTSPENFGKLYISESCTDSTSPSPGEDSMKDPSMTEDSKDFSQTIRNHSRPSPEKDLAKPLTPPQDNKDFVQSDTFVRNLSFLPSGKDFRNMLPVPDDDKDFSRDGGRCSPEDSRCSTTPDSSSSADGSDSNHSRSIAPATEESRLCLVEAKSTDSVSGAISGDYQKSPPGSDSKSKNETQKSGGNCDVELEGNDSWPVWVYCSRYSPRPSSGPRSRRQPKKSLSSEEKRCRTAFSGSQLARLRIEFQENPYLSEKRRLELARDLHLTESQVKIWFQNRRAKLKKASGQKNPLAMKLMEQGLYNHSTNKT